MPPRINYANAAPGAVHAMRGLEKYLHQCSLEPSLKELVKMRASQINGCAYCIDMHSKDARAKGETEQRLYGLSAWKETPFYSERERAALLWTEKLTLIAEEQEVSDDVYERVRQHFTEQEIMDLTLAVVAINGWNRIALSFRPDVGDYQPAQPSGNE
jgi:AhpD family alkylhydroperoxidase